MTGALHGTAGVLKEPAPEVVVTGFDGAQPRFQVLFWHAPELAERNRVGHAVAGLTRRDEVTPADPSIVVRADVVGD